MVWQSLQKLHGETGNSEYVSAFDVKKWADEMGLDIEPQANLTDFFLLCALELGDPSLPPDNSRKFYEMRRRYLKQSLKPASVLPPYDKDEEATVCYLQYLLWYQREKDRRLNNSSP